MPSNGMGGVRAFWQDNKSALILTDIILYVGNGDHKYSAFTVAELGQMFNPHSYGHSFYNNIGKKDGKYWAHTWQHSLGSGPILGWFASEAQCRAEMLIHLLQTGAITAKQVNYNL